MRDGHSLVLSTRRGRLGLLLAAGALGSAPVSAQSYVVTPAHGANHEASAGTSDPFGGTGRYQQIQGDLRGSARAFTGLAWRRDSTGIDNAFSFGRTMDLELALANSDLAAASATFANNHASAATTVFARRMVSSPDFRSQPVAWPAPWSLELVFDAPYAFAGTTDIVYDLKIHSTTSGNPYECDADSARSDALWGTVTTVGAGCRTTNGNMLLRSTWLTESTAGRLTMSWSVERGPSNQTAVVLLGITNPAVRFTALCRGYSVYTDASILVLGGATDAVGRWSTVPTLRLPWRPSYAGASLTSQAAAVDLSQGGFGVAASNGLTCTVAPAPQPVRMSRVYARSAPGAASGFVTPDYGLVTRWRY